MRVEGLTELQKDLLKVASNELPKETKQIMRKVGSAARTHIARYSRQRIPKHTGTFNKSFKRSRTFRAKDGSIAISVFNNAPHAFFLEHGHMIKSHGKEVGYTHGKNIMRDGMQDFDDHWIALYMFNDWLNQLLLDRKL